MKVMIDTNIIFDVLTEREPYYTDSALIWSWSKEKIITGFISAISINNIYYISKKVNGIPYAQKLVDQLLEEFEIISLTKNILKQARTVANKDYEDLIQYFSAIHEGCDILVTRNKKDFPAIGVNILEPRELAERILS
ncbi:MAG: PIN domain-containing protein [Actinomycetota bacterium]|nr:PIN domain-containing protein [Actinomycetota bacterium]